MPVSDPRIAQKGPFQVAAKAGESYWWCACGRSQTQPFCDGSHKGTGFSPVEYKPTEDGDLWFCGCKHSATPPLCDGTHSRL